MKTNANPLIDATDERRLRVDEISARNHSLRLQAVEARRDSIWAEDKLLAARKSAAKAERRRARLIRLEMLRDPAWWAGQIFRPKRILLGLFIVFIVWLTSLG